jgi:hypothetical protein
MIFGKAGADGNIKNEKGGLRRPFLELICLGR